MPNYLKRGAVDLLAGGGGGDLVLIEKIAPAQGGAVLFSAIPQTFQSLHLRGVGRAAGAASSTPLRLRFNGDTAANYDMQGYVSTGNTAPSSMAIFGHTWLYAGDVPGSAVAAGLFGSAVVDMEGYRNAAAQTLVQSCSSILRSTSVAADVATYGLYARWRSLAAVTSIEVAPDFAGGWALGSEFSLYGIT